jgi:gamma-resorcylate decarboxylase
MSRRARTTSTGTRPQNLRATAKALTEYVESHLLDVDERVRLMGKTGIERAIVSLTSPGIQSITDTGTAIRLARETNDLVRAQYVDKHPDRLSMFACIATQDPGEAAAELDRAVRDLGAVGVLVNGYTNVGDAQTGQVPRPSNFRPALGQDRRAGRAALPSSA